MLRLVLPVLLLVVQSTSLHADVGVGATPVNGAEVIIDGFVQLRGAEFDAAYAANELAYHRAVNDLVENTMIPNIENAEVKALFQQGLEIFKAHESHAAMMVKALQ